MRFKAPKNSEKFLWTLHAIEKMKYYGLSESRVKNVLFHPERHELGIAPETFAAMKRRGTKKHPWEHWVMYQTVIKLKGREPLKNFQYKIISTWKYPGQSQPGRPIPIPEEIKEELMNELEKLKHDQ